MAAFQSVFGTLPEVEASAPGRVNLLGEHTDYNEGFVLPVPLPYFTTVHMARGDRVEAYSELFRETRARPLEAGRAGDWLDYVAGCVWALRQAGFAIPGGRFLIRGEVPVGAGLSSSAALEVAVLRALRKLYRLELDDLTLAQLAQRAELEYVGVRCGIMDQIVASLGRQREALFLDTRTLQFERVQLPPGFTIVVVDSGLPRRLAEAGYNERRAQCEGAARLLGVRVLRDVTPADMERILALPEPLGRRARHVVTENDRVLLGVAALRKGDVVTFGRLMIESHRSLKEDFDVSTPELDRLVELALRYGAAGARLTGAGFGGAIVAMVPQSAIPKFREGFAREFPGVRFYSLTP